MGKKDTAKPKFLYQIDEEEFSNANSSLFKSSLMSNPKEGSIGQSSEDEKKGDPYGMGYWNLCFKWEISMHRLM